MNGALAAVRSFFALPVWRWVLPLAVFLMIVAAGWVFVRVWKAVGAKLAGKPAAAWARAVMPACVRPLRVLFLASALYALAALFPGVQASALALAAKLYRTALVILVAWAFCNVVSTPNLRESALFGRMEEQSKKSVLPLFSKALRFLLVLIAVLVVAQEWSFSVSGLIAGLGVGGLAVSLAAKDMLASMFGGLVIVLDKPFRIGDWVQVGDVEGIVEDISFRSVRVRTFTQAVVTLPNATVVDSAVTNFSRMRERRVVLKFTLDAQTPPARLRAAKEDLQKALKARKDINAKTATVSFDDVTDTGLLLSVVYFTRTTDWNRYIAIREDVLLAALQLLARHGASLIVRVREVRLPQPAQGAALSPAAPRPEKP